MNEVLSAGESPTAARRCSDVRIAIVHAAALPPMLAPTTAIRRGSIPGWRRSAATAPATSRESLVSSRESVPREP